MADSENLNVGNPVNMRRDAAERREPTVIPASTESQANDVFDDTVERSGRGRSVATPPVIAPAMRPEEPEADPMTGCPGCHPLGTATGAVAGGAAGAALTGLALGSVLGPFGAAVCAAAGGTIGALAGGFAGKSVAEAVNPTVEENYWRSRFATRPYVTPACRFEEYKEAYGFGLRTRREMPTLCFDEAEAALKARWEAASPPHVLPWKKACPAVCDAWDHLSPHDPDLG